MHISEQIVKNQIQEWPSWQSRKTLSSNPPMVTPKFPLFTAKPLMIKP